jgi:hypothetical protein
MTWYSKPGSGGQGLVIDEADGRTVAVAYDEKDAEILAAAPTALEEYARLSEWNGRLRKALTDCQQALGDAAVCRIAMPAAVSERFAAAIQTAQTALAVVPAWNSWQAPERSPSGFDTAQR